MGLIETLKANSDAVQPLIANVASVGMTAGSFEVTDEHGQTWRVEVTRL